MTLDQIKQLETRSNLTPFGESSYLIYKVDINGVDNARIVYQFTNNQLVQGRFLFMPTNRIDFARSIQQYKAIMNLMTSQYGQPQTNQQIHRFPDNALQTGAPMANELAADRLILKTSWQSDTSKMVHQLAWNNNQPHHQIHYIPVIPMASPAMIDTNM